MSRKRFTFKFLFDIFEQICVQNIEVLCLFPENNNIPRGINHRFQSTIITIFDVKIVWYSNVQAPQLYLLNKKLGTKGYCRSLDLLMTLNVINIVASPIAKINHF